MTVTDALTEKKEGRPSCEKRSLLESSNEAATDNKVTTRREVPFSLKLL